MKKLLMVLLAFGSTTAFACESSDKLCINDRVISDDGVLGIVKGIVPDGDVMVLFKGYEGYIKRPVDRLARTKGCAENALCVGDQVISDNSIVGTVAGILKKNEVMVIADGYEGFYRWSTKRLAATKGCTANHYCVGDVIISDSGFAGQVKAIAPDGDVMVAFNGHSGYYKWSTSRLAVTTACTK